MRAAIEAHDAGADVAIVSKLHPTRSHSGAAEGGINAALGNSGDDSPESHAFDTVKGSDYLGDQDSIEVFTREAPGDIYQLEHWGCVFSRDDDGKLAQRPVRRRRLAAHRLRRRHHRPRPDPGALRAARQARHQGLRGVLRLAARRARGPLPGRDRVGSPPRRAEGARRQDRPARDRRRRPALPRDHERLRLHRRRDVDGAARRPAAEGHRVHAVPPDDDVPERDPDHRGLPRRGRHPAQLRGRALHGALRADREGPRVPRRRLALRADRDRRGARHQRLRPARPHPPRRGEDPHAPARLARAGDGLRRRRPDPRADPGPAGRPLPHGRRRDRHGRPDRDDRALRRRRGRLRLGPRRQPARRQLADGDDHVRPPRRPRRRGVGAREHDRDRPGVGDPRRRARAEGAARPQRTASGPGRSATSSARRC